jgi:uracil-DNA glycosylase family 4
LDAAAELLALSRALRTELERRAHAGRGRYARPGELPPLEIASAVAGTGSSAGPSASAAAKPHGRAPASREESSAESIRARRPASHPEPGQRSAAAAQAPPASARPAPSTVDEASPWADSDSGAPDGAGRDTAAESRTEPGVLTPAPRQPRPSAPAQDPGPPATTADHQSPAALRDGPPTRQWAAQAADLGALAERVAGCRACGLCETRTQTVFSDGSQTAKVMFVGEAPGADEDRTGTPFVGQAGQLLSKIIAAGMGLDRARDTYIANVLKCRPPGNRDPEPREEQACTPYLERQIELVDPQVVIPLGRHASQHLLQSDLSMGKLRGRVHRPTSGPCAGRVVVPTYHPSYLLRSPSQKRQAWEDIQLAMKELGLPLKR